VDAGSGGGYGHRIGARQVSTPVSAAMRGGELPKGSAADVTFEAGALVVRAA